MTVNFVWHTTSTYCGAGNCVQVARLDNAYAIRDSKNPDQGVQFYTADEWHAFVDGVKKGDFDNLTLSH